LGPKLRDREGIDVSDKCHRTPAYSIVAVLFASPLTACGGGAGGSAPTGGATPGAVPDPPTLNALDFVDGGLSVAFDRPVVAGGLSITSYSATCVAGDVKTSVNGTASPIAVLGLTAGTEYACSVTATNAFGESKPSRVLKATPLESRTLSVVPVLGGVSAGVKAEIFRADSGERLGGATTQATGIADVKYFSSYKGVLVVKVTGAADATYYDERVDGARPLPASQSLLAVLPQSIADKSSVQYGVTTLTNAVAIGAGVQGTAAGVTVPTTLGADSLNAAAVKVMVYFGLDPTKIDLSIVPERLRVTDVGTGKRLDGTEQQLNYGAVLIAIAKLAPTGVSVSEFSQIVAAEIKAGVSGSSSNLLKGFADAYSATVKNTVVPAMQTKIASPPSPGAFPWDSAVWDSATWY